MLWMINIKDRTKSNQVISHIPYYGVGGTHSAIPCRGRFHTIPSGAESVSSDLQPIGSRDPSHQYVPPGPTHRYFSSNPFHDISQQPRQTEGAGMSWTRSPSPAPHQLVNKGGNGRVQWITHRLPSFHHWRIQSQILRIESNSSIPKVGFSFPNLSWIFSIKQLFTFRNPGACIFSTWNSSNLQHSCKPTAHGSNHTFLDRRRGSVLQFTNIFK